MNTTAIKRTVAAIGLICLLSGGMMLTAATPANAKPDPGGPFQRAAQPTRVVERRVEVPVPFDDNAVEPAQIALGALGGAALACAVVVGNNRRTRRLAELTGLRSTQLSA